MSVQLKKGWFASLLSLYSIFGQSPLEGILETGRSLILKWANRLLDYGWLGSDMEKAASFKREFGNDKKIYT